MAIFAWALFLLLTNYPGAERVQAVQDSLFGIVEPFPENIYPFEFTPANVTCVAYDPSGVKIPSKILFVRRQEFNQYTELIENDNLYFTNRTETQDNKTKLSVTLYIRNVTLDDDSLFGALGSYQCHGFAKGDVKVRARHGFSVSVITRDEIPEVKIFPDSDVHSLQYNENITLTCNITKKGNKFYTPIKKISWLKNGVPSHSVRYPDPQVPEDTLRPLFIKNDGAKIGGNYTCLLEVLFRNVREYSVSAQTMIVSKHGTVIQNNAITMASYNTLVLHAFLVVSFLYL